MASNRKGDKKNNKSSSKAEKAELDRILNEIDKETKALQTPSSQKLLFFGSAFWAASAPLYLYIKGVFEVAFKENIAAFGIGAVIAAFILLPVYNVVATGNRDKLIAASRTTALLEGVTEERKKKDRLAVSQSGYYALFAVNMLYLVFFLLFIAYILPAYELSHPINFAVASILSAASVYGLGSSARVL